MPYRTVKTYPPEVAEILERINALPKDEVDLKRFKKVMTSLLKRTNKVLFGQIIKYDDSVSEKEAERLRRRLDCAFDQAIRKEFAGRPHLQNLAQIIGYWCNPRLMETILKDLETERENVRSIIRAVEARRATGLAFHMPIIRRTTKILIDANWIISEVEPDPLSIFQENKTSLARLLDCHECGRIVWRKKHDAKTCGASKCRFTRANRMRKEKSNGSI